MPFIDESVAELSPNLYNAARASGLSPEQSKFLNQWARQYKKGAELLKISEISARRQFLELEPEIQESIRMFFPDKKIFEPEKTAFQEVLSMGWKIATANIQVLASPFMLALKGLENWEKTTKTPYPVLRQQQEASRAQQLNLPVTKRPDFTHGILKDTFDGKNNWKWDKVNTYEQRYGVAYTTLARAMAEGRTPGEAIDLYGKADEEMMFAIAQMYNEPEKFNRIKDNLKLDAQISPGRDVVQDKFGFVGKTVEGNYWQGVAQRLLGVQPMVVLPKGITPESKKGQDLLKREETRQKEKVSGIIDGFYTIFIDPFTYAGLGLPAVAKTVAKGVGGVKASVKEAVQMAAFKTKGQRLAEQFKFISEKRGTAEAGFQWLFQQPEIITLWDDLGPRLKSYDETTSPSAKASILESIKFDYPEWYNDKVINTLVSEKVFDVKSAERFFTYVDDTNMMLNGRVNGISFRRNGIPFARKTRTLTSAMHRVAYAVFNPKSEIDITTKEILDKADAEAVKAMTVLTKVADDENKLLNPEISNLFEIQQDIGWARRKAYKLGVAASRVPGVIRFGDDSVETANDIRNTANLVLPKNIANAVTIMLLDQPLDIQLTAVRNMQYAFMKRLNVPEEDIQNILKQTFSNQGGFKSVVDLPIADNIASQMHPMAVTFANNRPQLAATGAIEPSQLKKAIKQLPFDLIYQLSAKANLDKLSKATPANAFIKLLNGVSRWKWTQVYNNNWAAYTLAPRLGIRTNVDEGFFYYLTKPIADVLDLVASKFQKDIKGMQALTGSSKAIGPWKGSLYAVANKFNITVDGRPLDPRKILTPEQANEVVEKLRLELSKPRTEGGLGYEVSLEEIQPTFIKEQLLSRIVNIFGGEGPEWDNLQRLFRNNSNFLDSFANSMGARDLMVGKIDKDFFDAVFSEDQLSAYIKSLGLERSNIYTPREIKKLGDWQTGIAMWDNFVLRFGYNQIKLTPSNYLNPVDVFFKHNGLKNEDFFGALKPNNNFSNARSDLMEQMGAGFDDVTGAYATKDAKLLQAALSNWSETIYYRQQGMSDPEIARVYSERILNDMRFAFHGSESGFNQNLYDLITKKREELIKRSKLPRDERIKNLGPYSWSRAANSLTWKEFDEATVDMRPTSGYINTRLISSGKVTDLDVLKENLSTIDKLFEKLPDKVLEMMDRQVTGFFRLPAMRVAINKAFKDLEPYEKMLSDRHYRAILTDNPGMDPDIARARANEIADKTVTNTAVNMATDSVLEFVDNPNIRSNFALSIRHVGRFFRATEDFQRRVYRLYANEGPRALMRLRLLHYGLENFGSIYEDEKGDQYLTFPTDIVMNTAIQKTLNAFNIDYKVGSFNDFSLKFRLLNPSFAPDAGVPAFAGPIAGLYVLGAKWFLRDLPVVSAFLPESWEDTVYPWTNDAADFLDTFAMGHIGRNTDFGELIRLSFPMLATTTWDALAPTELNRIKSNYVLQAISYQEAFGNGVPEFADNKEKVKFLNNMKTAAGNIAVAQTLLGMVSPAYPQLKDSKGLPEFIKDNGISTWSSAFWDIYQGIIQSEPDVTNPFELAVATFVGKNPGKAVYTIPKTNKAFRTVVAKTNELKEWSQENRRFIDNYKESGIAYVFAPMSGEYNADIYNWLESQGLVEPTDFADYLQKVQIAKDKEKYFAIDDALNKKLETTADYQERTRLINLANNEQKALTVSNPMLEDYLDSDVSKGELRNMLQDLAGATNDPASPISENTRAAMRLAINEVRSFIDFSNNPVYGQTYTFTDDRKRMKEEVMSILSELVFDPAVKEATRLIFVPLMNNYSRDAMSASVERGGFGGR